MEGQEGHALATAASGANTRHGVLRGLLVKAKGVHARAGSVTGSHRAGCALADPAGGQREVGAVDGREQAAAGRGQPVLREAVQAVGVPAQLAPRPSAEPDADVVNLVAGRQAAQGHVVGLRAGTTSQDWLTPLAAAADMPHSHALGFAQHLAATCARLQGSRACNMRSVSLPTLGG